jgi:putative lipoprotein (rSAM/lipoprotein system)
MKKRNTFFKTLNIVLTGLLAIFGFSNCEPRMEYGTPNADYTVKGKVLNKVDSKPVKGIRVGYRPFPGAVTMYGVLPMPYTLMAADTTDTAGDYKVKENFMPGILNEKEVPVYIQDIDGTENGLFQDTTINVNFENAVKTGKRTDWYDGELTIELEVKLTPKEAGNE